MEMEASSCPGYGELGCPSRFKCYPSESDGNNGEFNCLCDRTFMLKDPVSGCRSTDPFVIFTCFVGTILVFVILWTGASTLVQLLKRRYMRRPTPLDAIWTCVFQVFFNIAFLIMCFCDFLHLWWDVGNWYHPHGRYVIQEAGVFLLVLVALSVSHFIFGQARRLGLIGQRALHCARAVFISFQIIVPSLTWWYRLHRSQSMADSHYLSLLRIVSGLFCISSLLTTGCYVQAYIKRRRPNAPAETLEKTARLAFFTKEYSITMLVLLLATSALHYVEQNYGRYPAISSHLLLLFQWTGMMHLSQSVYKFLSPPSSRVIEGNVLPCNSTRRGLISIAASVFEHLQTRITSQTNKKVFPIIAEEVAAGPDEEQKNT